MQPVNGESSQSNEKGPISIPDKTRWCINLINSLPDSNQAEILILLGRPGVGKSSVLENATGASGHAGDGTDPVTKTFQIESFGSGQPPLFVMDTPGINTSAEETALIEIARGIDRIRSKARIVGVLFVTRIMDRNEDIDDKLRHFLLSFCGSRFMQQVTFVTTHWTVMAEAQKSKYNQNLEELKRRNQADFIDNGAKFYEHGREFVDGGGSSQFLNWWTQQSEIAECAKNMIRSWYGGNHDGESPYFVQQLESGVAVLETDAARSLGISSNGAESESTSAPRQEQDTPNTHQQSRETPESTPSPPRSTTAGTNTTGAEQERDRGRYDQEQTEPSFLQKIWDSALSLQPSINITNGEISVTLSSPQQGGNIRGNFQRPFNQGHAPRNQGGPPGQPRAWPSRFDRNSPADNMEARGFDPSLQSRQQMASDWGVNLPGTPGDIQWGTAFLRELNRRHPW